MRELKNELQSKLKRLASALIDQERARILVRPTRSASGYWFGGGNAVRDPDSGDLLLIGRYRDAGDSRTGLAQGPRGRELAIFRSVDGGRSFEKIRSWAKADFGGTDPVLSREGSALLLQPGKVEVLVSTERRRSYPRQLREYQKPGTGIWGIDRFSAPTVEALEPGRGLRPLLRGGDPSYLHLKDPNVSPGFEKGQHLLLYCAHPYTWSSSTSGCAVLTPRSCRGMSDDFFPRGPSWDVAATRITC